MENTKAFKRSSTTQLWASCGENTGLGPCVLSQVTVCSCENHFLRTVVVFMGRIGMLFYMISECSHKLVFQDFGIIRWAGMRKGEKWRKREEEKIESRNPSKWDPYSRITWVCRWEGGSRKWGECRKLGRLGRLWGTPAKTAFSLELRTDWYYVLSVCFEN